MELTVIFMMTTFILGLILGIILVRPGSKG